VEEGPLSDDGWLSVSVGDIDTEGEGVVVCVNGEEGMERAVEVRLLALISHCRFRLCLDDECHSRNVGTSMSRN
jgi:hypothetical protein